MPSPSAVINRSLRAHVVPALREAGFEAVDARHGREWAGPVIRVFHIRAVGAYFSSVTGWPAASVGVWLGVFFDFIPPPPRMKTDGRGRRLPAEHECHLRSHLDRRNAGRPRRALPNPAENSRTDLWWLDPDGSNADDVARDIAEALRGPGSAWYARASDPERALDDVEKEHDCFVKFVLARYLARAAGRGDLERKYASLAEQEGRRIGQEVGPEGWFPLHGGLMRAGQVWMR